MNNMRLFFFILFSLVSTFLNGQIVPNSSRATLSNKSYFPTQAVPTDFRSQYYDSVNFIMRDYRSTAEVLAYLNLAKYRSGRFPIYIHNGGTLNINGTYTGGVTEYWWFKDGVADGSLVKMIDNKQAEFNSYDSMRSLPASMLDTSYIYYRLSDGTVVSYRYVPDDTTTPDDSATTIVTTTGARLRIILDDYVMAYVFGALPSDGVDDTRALQKAINWCVAGTDTNHMGIRALQLQPGLYETSGPLIIWRDADGDGNPEQVNFNLRGAIPALIGYTGGESQIHSSQRNSFTIGIMRGRGVTIDNIFFSGPNQLNYGLDSALNGNATYKKFPDIRSNMYSPHACIVVDWGSGSTPTDSMYPGLKWYYDSVGGGGGSTGCRFRDIRIDGFYVGIIMTPGLGMQNNEGHTIENIWVENAYVGYASTNSQERTVEINQWYSWKSVRTVFDTYTFGAQRGDPPHLNMINLAGGTYRAFLFQGVGGYFPNVYITNFYAEVLYTLGVLSANTSTISGGQISFASPEEFSLQNTLRIPNTVLTGGYVKLSNMTIVYYNGGTKVPMNMTATGVEFDNCFLGAQIGYPNNASSQEPLKVKYNNTRFYTLAGFIDHNTPVEMLGYDKPTGNSTVYAPYGKIFGSYTTGQLQGNPNLYIYQERKVISPLVRHNYVGQTVLLTVSGDSATATIATLSGKTWLEGELIWDASSSYGQVMRIRRITGSTVCFDRLTQEVATGSYAALHVETVQAIGQTIIADASGTSLTNVRIEGSTSAYTMPVGRYYTSGVAIDVTSSGAGTATLSSAVYANGERIVISGVDYMESGYSYAIPTSNGYVAGGTSFLRGSYYKNVALNGDSEVEGWVCSKSGITGTSIPPEFRVVYRYNGSLYRTNITSSRAAAETDLDRLLIADNTSGSINITVNPTTFDNKKLIIKAVIPGGNTITITPTSGTIDGASSYSMAPGQVVTIWANGGNFYIINSYVPGGS